jgi:hypothetical protein
LIDLSAKSRLWPHWLDGRVDLVERRRLTVVSLGHCLNLRLAFKAARILPAPLEAGTGRPWLWGASPMLAFLITDIYEHINNI